MRAKSAYMKAHMLMGVRRLVAAADEVLAVGCETIEVEVEVAKAAMAPRIACTTFMRSWIAYTASGWLRSSNA